MKQQYLSAKMASEEKTEDKKMENILQVTLKGIEEILLNTESLDEAQSKIALLVGERITDKFFTDHYSGLVCWPTLEDVRDILEGEMELGQQAAYEAANDL